jgi:hypothetical protein
MWSLLAAAMAVLIIALFVALAFGAGYALGTAERTGRL